MELSDAARQLLKRTPKLDPNEIEWSMIVALVASYGDGERDATQILQGWIDLHGYLETPPEGTYKINRPMRLRT